MSDTARRVAGLLTTALCLALGVWLLSDEPAGTAVAAALGGAAAGGAGAYVAWRGAARRGRAPRQASLISIALSVAAGFFGYSFAKNGGWAGGALLVAGAAYLVTFAILGPPRRPPL